MGWKKVPKENEELLDRLMEAIPEAERRKMFGCPCYFLHGNMFVGAHEENFILRLSDGRQPSDMPCNKCMKFHTMSQG